jgi:hypothetical protein
MEVLALKREPFAFLSQTYHFKCFFGTALPVSNGYLKGIEAGRLITDSNAQNQPAFSGEVNRRAILGYVHRMM